MANPTRFFWAATGVGILGFLLACGGQQGGPQSAKCDASGFVNQTNGFATSSDLAEMWQRAQHTLATETIPLNPVKAQFQHVPLTYIAADPRAYDIHPSCTTVRAVADLAVAALPASLRGKGYVDPTGVIRCGGPTGYCHSYTDNHDVWVAQSMVLNDGATGWEFQNIILTRLGHDDSGR